MLEALDHLVELPPDCSQDEKSQHADDPERDIENVLHFHLILPTPKAGASLPGSLRSSLHFLALGDHSMFVLAFASIHQHVGSRASGDEGEECDPGDVFPEFHGVHLGPMQIMSNGSSEATFVLQTVTFGWMEVDVGAALSPTHRFAPDVTVNVQEGASENSPVATARVTTPVESQVHPVIQSPDWEDAEQVLPLLVTCARSTRSCPLELVET
jgi:hypothetical protein